MARMPNIVPSLSLNFIKKILNSKKMGFWPKVIFALVVNFLITGSGFALYGKFWIGVPYLIAFVALRFFQQEIGAIWQILVMATSYIHLFYVIRKDFKGQIT